MKKFNLLKSIGILTAFLAVGFITSCNEDKDDPVADVVASFQFEVNADNFLQVDFTNASSVNASSYSWDFGDSNSSTDESPSHTYGTTGTYDVVLTATGDAGSDTFTKSISITDPDEALTLLVGETSKTWKLVREGTAMLLAADPQYSAIYWPGSSNDGQRPCLYDDAFTFGRDGSYTYNDAGTFWAEYGIFNGGIGASGCDTDTTPEGCFEATAANMVNECGDDVSAWLSGTHSFAYNSGTGKITLTGMGAWIGIPKLGTTADNNVSPQSSVIFDAVVVDGGASGVDTLHANFTYAGTFWPVTYVSYSDASLEPALVSVSANFGASANGLTATFVNQSSGATVFAWDFGDGGSSSDENPMHTYASAGTYTVTLTASDAGGSSATATNDVSVSEVALSEPAPTPTRDAANVISVYSDAYTDISGVDTNPNWGQATVVTGETVQGDNVLLLSGLNYQGIDFGGEQDLTGKTFVHLDVWSASATTVNLSLISTGPAETPYGLTITAGQWNSYDIALSEYSSVVDITKTIQFKFDDAGSGSSPSIYVDNIYFYNE